MLFFIWHSTAACPEIEAMAYGDGISRAAPLVLSLMQVSSCIVELPLLIDQSNSRITLEFIVWIMIIFSPILLLRLVRQNLALVCTMAIPVVTIFCGRVHYALLFLRSKPLPQMGDWAIWLNSFFGLASVIIVAGWIFVRAIGFLIDFSIRAIASFRKAKV
jgi:hypothetical protein